MIFYFLLLILCVYLQIIVCCLGFPQFPSCFGFYCFFAVLLFLFVMLLSHSFHLIKGKNALRFCRAICNQESCYIYNIAPFFEHNIKFVGNIKTHCLLIWLQLFLLFLLLWRMRSWRASLSVCVRHWISIQAKHTRTSSSDLTSFLFFFFFSFLVASLVNISGEHYMQDTHTGTGTCCRSQRLAWMNKIQAVFEDAVVI